jgi:preprotein translocase subunit SecF
MRQQPSIRCCRWLWLAAAAVDKFAIAMVFGIVVGLSIFIAAPILLFLGEGRLRPKRQPVDVGAQASLTGTSKMS